MMPERRPERLILLALLAMSAVINICNVIVCINHYLHRTPALNIVPQVGPRSAFPDFSILVCPSYEFKQVAVDESAKPCAPNCAFTAEWYTYVTEWSTQGNKSERIDYPLTHEFAPRVLTQMVAGSSISCVLQRVPTMKHSLKTWTALDITFSNQVTLWSDAKWFQSVQIAFVDANLPMHSVQLSNFDTTQVWRKQQLQLGLSAKRYKRIGQPEDYEFATSHQTALGQDWLQGEEMKREGNTTWRGPDKFGVYLTNTNLNFHIDKFAEEYAYDVYSVFNSVQTVLSATIFIVTGLVFKFSYFDSVTGVKAEPRLTASWHSSSDAA